MLIQRRRDKFADNCNQNSDINWKHIIIVTIKTYYIIVTGYLWLFLRDYTSDRFEIFFSLPVDVDECQSPDACHPFYVCNNTFGSYRCECPLGYVKDSGPQNPLNPVCVGENF